VIDPDGEPAQIVASHIVITTFVSAQALSLIGDKENVALDDEAVLIVCGDIKVPADKGGEEPRPAELGARVDGEDEDLRFRPRRLVVLAFR
jgi:hypothetical protein